MTTCPICGNYSAYRTIENNSCGFNTLYVLSHRQLLQRERYQNMARYIAALPISSRDVPNWLAEKIFWFEGQILWPDGQVFSIGDEDIDLAFNDDQSFRWIRSFRNRAETPLKQRPQERLATRLRLVALALEIDLRTNESVDGLRSLSAVRPD